MIDEGMIGGTVAGRGLWACYRAVGCQRGDTGFKGSRRVWRGGGGLLSLFTHPASFLSPQKLSAPAPSPTLITIDQSYLSFTQCVFKQCKFSKGKRRVVNHVIPFPMGKGITWFTTRLFPVGNLHCLMTLRTFLPCDRTHCRA